MKRAYWWTAGLVLITSLGAGAQQKPVDLDVQFKTAERKELVEGDLKGAIELYRQIVSQAGANRGLAARALLRMAESYQKQGDGEARRIYERLVRDYSDQREAATVAQARLGNAVTGDRRATSFRKVWTGDVLGTVSHDGRYLSYVDWVAGNLMLHDFQTGSDRPITGNTPGSWPASGDFAEESAISRDASQVAYAWLDASNRRYELRVASLRGTGLPTSRRLLASDEFLWIGPYDWSPDNRWIAVVIQRKDAITQLGLVGTADGTLRILKTVDWRGPTKIFFSPDGRYLGYDLPAPGIRQRDIFVLAVDGSREIPAVTLPSHETMMGWSPDGSRLLFASDRSGATGLWALAFRDGNIQGLPEMLQPNIGSAWAMGLTRHGALYLGVSAGGQEVEVTTIDIKTGRQVAPPVKPVQRFSGANREPAWSPDGRFLAFRSERGLSGNGRDVVLGVLDVETGDVRDVVPDGIRYFNSISWAPDGQSVAIGGTDLKGRQGVYRVNVHSGDVEPVAVASGLMFVGHFPEWAPDGKSIYYRRRHPEGGTHLVVRDLNTGAERRLLTETGLGPRFSVSPDGQWVAVVATDPSSGVSRCLLAPASGGPVREILRRKRPESIEPRFITWSADGSGVIVRAVAEHANEGRLIHVPIDGSTPVPLDLDVERISSPPLRIHRDGQRVAYTVGSNSTEVWVLENFLPAPRQRR